MATAVPTVADWPFPAFITIWFTGPATGVMAPLVPVVAPASVPVTVYAVPATVGVNITVAIPFELVELLASEKLPPVPVFDQVTTFPPVVFATPVSELSCADMVTPAPVTGE